MNRDWAVAPADIDFFARHLNSFLPPRIFDAHCHLYHLDHFNGSPPPLPASGPPLVDWDCFIRHMDAIAPGRHWTALCFPFPAPSLDCLRTNLFLAQQAARQPNCKPQLIVTPRMDPDSIRQAVAHHRFVGLKCYHVFAPSKPTFNAPVEDYLPEEHVRLAHQLGLTITLHLVRPRALADPLNQQSIIRLATRYPNSRWILAHAARGFNPYHTVEGIHALGSLPNVWFDTSAVTEPGAFEAIVRVFGVDKLLYGGDFPVTHLRGRCVAIGDSFLWLTAANTNFSAPYAELQPVLVMLESLRALKHACWNLGLSDTAIERIFYDNAAALFNS